jgi:hypothetical protein
VEHLRAVGLADRDGDREPGEVDQVGRQISNTPLSKSIEAQRTARRLASDEIARSLSGQLDDLAERAELAADDPKIAGFGLNECEAALAECMPAALHEPTWRQLWALGVDLYAAAGYFDRLFVEAVVVDNAGGFEFSRNCADQRGSVVAVVFAVRDATGEVVDLAALDLTSGALATWRGRAAMLGEDYVLRPRFGPLPVYTTAVEWLCDARGVFIIDAKRAAPVLELHTLATVDRRAGIALRAALAKGTRRPLKIMIPAEKRRG